MAGAFAHRGHLARIDIEGLAIDVHEDGTRRAVRSPRRHEKRVSRVTTSSFAVRRHQPATAHRFQRNRDGVLNRADGSSASSISFPDHDEPLAVADRHSRDGSSRIETVLSLQVEYGTFADMDLSSDAALRRERIGALGKHRIT
jgi:hypothetical protein